MIDRLTTVLERFIHVQRIVERLAPGVVEDYAAQLRPVENSVSSSQSSSPRRGRTIGENDVH